MEIMSPAGNFECLQAAIQGGADSIYFGIGMLNMRSRSANNFRPEDLSEIVEICGSKGIKTYLTINTVMFDEDIPAMREAIDAAKAAGVDAVIVSDRAAIIYAAAQGVKIHLSTQINISNYEALSFYARYADVVVLARELNLKQVKNIYDKITENDLRGPSGNLIRLEMFAHGALCMAASGKCYLSLHEYNASANRGGCYQICRRSYIVTDKETGRRLEIDNQYIMSPKDLCTIGFTDKMIDAGVRILKIEGRARSAEYVKTVTRCYSEVVRAIIDNRYTKEMIDDRMKRLGSVFNRGFWDGYYLGRTSGEWSESYGNKAAKRKTKIGKVTNCFDKIGVAEFLIESGTLSVGDEILIIGPATGVVETKAEEIRVNLEPALRASKGEYCSVRVPEKVRRGDKLFVLTESDEI